MVSNHMSNERLDRIEKLLEKTAENGVLNTSKIDLNSSKIDKLADQVLVNSSKIDKLADGQLQLGVKLESIHDEVKIIGEAVTGHSSKLDDHETRILKLES